MPVAWLRVEWTWLETVRGALQPKTVVSADTARMATDAAPMGQGPLASGVVERGPALYWRYENDISCWPLDVWCVFASGQDLFLVGNVNTASRLEDVGRISGLPVTVVVSMLQSQEMKARGAPSEYRGCDFPSFFLT